MSSAALRRHGPLGLALLLLAVLWIGPLPARAETSFAAHMVLHMGVVALAAPLLAFSLGRSGLLPASAATGRFVLPAALLEFLLIWGWHAPALHDAARQHVGLFALEQGSFLLAGLAMLVLPGQGLLTMLIGLLLLDFPGKRALERRVVRRPKILAFLNRMRDRRGREPLRLE